MFQIFSEQEWSRSLKNMTPLIFDVETDVDGYG